MIDTLTGKGGPGPAVVLAVARAILGNIFYWPKSNLGHSLAVRGSILRLSFPSGVTLHRGVDRSCDGQEQKLSLNHQTTA